MAVVIQSQMLRLSAEAGLAEASREEMIVFVDSGEAKW